MFFNLGYIYADVIAIQAELEKNNDGDDSTEPNYKNLGIYSGDTLIRFFWRRRFTKNFTYGDTVLETE